MKDYGSLCEKYGWFLTNDEYNYYSINEYLTERLKFTSADDFLLQLKSTNSFINDFLTRQDGNYFYLNSNILKKHSLDELNNELKKFSYRICRKYTFPGYFIEEIQIVPENDTNVKYDFNNRYIHISPKDNLDIISIKPKSSKNKFETYDARIYLFPIESLIEQDVDVSSANSIFSSIHNQLKNVARQFNSVKGTNNEYYAYMVEINKNYAIYKDHLFKSRDAVYIFNTIIPKHIVKLGSI